MIPIYIYELSSQYGSSNFLKTQSSDPNGSFREGAVCLLPNPSGCRCIRRTRSNVAPAQCGSNSQSKLTVLVISLEKNHALCTEWPNLKMLFYYIKVAAHSSPYHSTLCTIDSGFKMRNTMNFYLI